MSRGVNLHNFLMKLSFLGLQFQANISFISLGLIERAEGLPTICCIAKKQGVLGISTDWFRQKFDLPVAPWVLKEIWNLEHSLHGCNCHSASLNLKVQG